MIQVQPCTQPREFPKMVNRGHPQTAVGPFLHQLSKKGETQVVATKAIPFAAEWKATESQLLSPSDLSLPLPSLKKKWERTRIGNIALLPFTLIGRKPSKATHLNCFFTGCVHGGNSYGTHFRAYELKREFFFPSSILLF